MKFPSNQADLAANQWSMEADRRFIAPSHGCGRAARPAPNAKRNQYFREISAAGRGSPLQKSAAAFMRRRYGEMAEWLKAHAWKACVRETVPWVRIPLSPPANLVLRKSWAQRPSNSGCFAKIFAPENRPGQARQPWMGVETGFFSGTSIPPWLVWCSKSTGHFGF